MIFVCQIALRAELFALRNVFLHFGRRQLYNIVIYLGELPFAPRHKDDSRRLRILYQIFHIPRAQVLINRNDYSDSGADGQIRQRPFIAVLSQNGDFFAFEAETAEIRGKRLYVVIDLAVGYLAHAFAFSENKSRVLRKILAASVAKVADARYFGHVIYKIVQVLFAHFYLRKTNFSSGFSYGKSSA